MWMPVPESPDPETSFEPMPRIWKLYPVKFPLEKFTFGIARTRFGPPSILDFWRLSWLKAETAIGTSWIASSFFWAVTTSSSMTLVAPAPPSAAAAAKAGWARAVIAAAETPMTSRLRNCRGVRILFPPMTAELSTPVRSVSIRRLRVAEDTRRAPSATVKVL